MMQQRRYLSHQELRPGTTAACRACKAAFTVDYITDTLCAACATDAVCAQCPNRAGVGQAQWCGKCHRG